MFRSISKAVYSVAIILVMLGVVILANRSAEAQVCSVDNWCWQHPLPQGLDINGIWTLNSTFSVAVGGMGTILRYDGSNWTPMVSGTVNDLRGVWGTSASDIFAVGDGGVIIHYDGGAWSSQNSTTVERLVRSRYDRLLRSLLLPMESMMT